MKNTGDYRTSLLNITDVNSKRQNGRKRATPRITAKFYRGQDINILLTDLEALGALSEAIDHAIELATNPERSHEFRNLTIRVQGDTNRVTVTLKGYISSRRAKKLASASKAHAPVVPAIMAA